MQAGMLAWGNHMLSVVLSNDLIYIELILQ